MRSAPQAMTKCNGFCSSFDGNCPFVKPYPDGSKRTFHSEVKCKTGGEKWLWGLSWDGSGDGKFNCRKLHAKENL